MGFVSDLSLLVMMSVCFVIGIAISVPSLVSLGGQLEGKQGNILLFLGTSIGPIISIYLMKIGGYAQTFILLGMILFIGFVAN